MIDRKKKILLVITKSNYGGAQRYTHELARAWKAEGHEVAVACGGDGLLTKKLQASEIARYDIAHFKREVNIWNERKAIHELSHVIQTFKPDIIHLNSTKAGLIGTVLARFHGVKRIIFTAHGWPFLEPRNIAWRSVVWLGSYITALCAHAVIVVSDNDKYSAHMPFLRHTLTTIHPAIEVPTYQSREDARSQLFSEEEVKKHLDDWWIVTTAELNYNKNHYAAIDAIVEYNKKNDQQIFYTIIGDGVLKKHINAHINARNAAEYISLLGYVDEAARHLKAFDSFLLTSKKEGFPYVLLEAGHAGMPVIASKVGGIPEIIQNSTTGILIDPISSDSIVTGLCATKQEYGQALKTQVSTQHTLHTMIDKTRTVYAQS